MRNKNLTTEVLMLRYLVEHPQSYPDLNVKADFSEAETRKAF